MRHILGGPLPLPLATTAMDLLGCNTDVSCNLVFVIASRALRRWAIQLDCFLAAPARLVAMTV